MCIGKIKKTKNSRNKGGVDSTLKQGNLQAGRNTKVFFLDFSFWGIDTLLHFLKSGIKLQ
jgi:hypothetical protein